MDVKKLKAHLWQDIEENTATTAEDDAAPDEVADADKDTSFKQLWTGVCVRACMYVCACVCASMRS